MKIFMKKEEDLKLYLAESLDKTKPRNWPEEFPCIIIADFYKIAHETGNFERFLEFIYRRDVLSLMIPQLEGPKE